LPMLEAWAEDTETGDVAELTGLRDGDEAWREVASSSETRLGASCAHFDACFVTRMRRDADAARLLVVNHHLFFADLAVKVAMGRGGGPRGGALPPYDAVIFDEAHQLEDIATGFFGTRVSRARVERMLRDAERSFHAAGLSDLLGRGEGTALIALVREAAEALLAPVAQLAMGAAADAGRVTIAADAWQGELRDAYHRLDTVLEALDGYAETHAVNDAVGLVGHRAQALREDLARVIDPATNQVTWVELRGRSIAFGASPVDVGPLMRERVFDQIGGVVLTSATLTTAASARPRAVAEEPIVPATGRASYRFFRGRMGLAEPCDVPVDELEVPSPFDYAARALLYTPRDLPEANDGGFVERAADRAAELCTLTGGGAFMLCTSNRALRAFAQALRRRLRVPPLVQGDAPKGALLGRFRAAGSAVLVATMSFWEGVDVPGEALRLVIIDKIPFAVPSDPIVAARCAAIEEGGENPFLAYSVPQAAITLKQGFGRLLRTRSDRGVVAVLDRRIVTRSYGRLLTESLPPVARTERLQDVSAFWARTSAELQLLPAVATPSE
jgi:ATP-dependent DNA helicase DinG